jgi:hypothetical protein
MAYVWGKRELAEMPSCAAKVWLALDFLTREGGVTGIQELAEVAGLSYSTALKGHRYLVERDWIDESSRPIFVTRSNNPGVSVCTKLRILKRDSYKCTLCESSYDLAIHHIKRKRDGGTNEDDNLTTLCVKCHKKQHGSRK